MSTNMSSTTMSPPTEPLPTITIAAPPAAKKRRRRTPASGAADDCFTCRKEGTKCDRRRPYCQQCLDRGQTCSGYKTQLTWGVGVASRGKLRGLALPIAGSAALPTKPVDRRARRKAVSVDESAAKKAELPAQKMMRATSFSGAVNTVAEFSFDDLTTPMSAPLAPLHEVDWPTFTEADTFSMHMTQAPSRSLLSESLLQLPVSTNVWEELTVPNSASTTFSSWSESDYASVDLPPTPEDMSFLTGSSLPMQSTFFGNSQSLCPSPISPVFSHGIMSPTYMPSTSPHNFMLDSPAPTSYPAPRMHARTTSTISCPTYWEPSSMFKSPPTFQKLPESFCDDRDFSALGVYPTEWDPITLMM